MVEWKKLEDICIRITDGSHFSPQAVEQGYYMPSVKDMTASGFDFSFCKQISETDYLNLVKNGCRPQKGDVLVAKDGSMLKYVFPINKEEDIVVLSSIALLSPKQEILNSAYLSYYLLRSDIKEKTIREFSSKGGVPRIILKNFKKIQVPIPSLEEQKRIVAILDTFTDSIENLKQQIDQRRKQYEHYRDQLLDLEGKEGVEMKTLGEVCEIKGRIGFRGYTREDQVEKGEGALTLTATNISNQRIDYSNNTYITWEKYYESPEIMVTEGDIIVCQRGSIGKIAIIENLKEKATINPQLLLLKNIKCNNRYLIHCLLSRYFQDSLNKIIGYGTIQMIAQKDLKVLQIPLLNNSEQQRIVSILDTFEASISNLEAQLEQRQKQYEYYRNKLLSFEKEEQ